MGLPSRSELVLSEAKEDKLTIVARRPERIALVFSFYSNLLAFFLFSEHQLLTWAPHGGAEQLVYAAACGCLDR